MMRMICVGCLGFWVGAFNWPFDGLLIFPISRFMVLPGASLGPLPAAIASLSLSGLIGLPKGSQTVKLVRFGVTSFSYPLLFGAAFTRRCAVGPRSTCAVWRGRHQDPSHARFCGSRQRSCPEDDGALASSLPSDGRDDGHPPLDGVASAVGRFGRPLRFAKGAEGLTSSSPSIGLSAWNL